MYAFVLAAMLAASPEFVAVGSFQMRDADDASIVRPGIHVLIRGHSESGGQVRVDYSGEFYTNWRRAPSGIYRGTIEDIRPLLQNEAAQRASNPPESWQLTEQGVIGEELVSRYVDAARPVVAGIQRNVEVFVVPAGDYVIQLRFVPITAVDRQAWLNSRDYGITVSDAGDKPVMFLYSADWCTFCQRLKSDMDKEVLPFTPIVVEAVPGITHLPTCEWTAANGTVVRITESNLENLKARWNQSQNLN